jgi:hypothetical protein
MARISKAKQAAIAARALELSTLDQAAFDALPDEEKEKFIADATAALDADKPDALPDEVTLLRPYAFYDEDNTLHSWSDGQVVKDADQIKTLLDRGAPLAEISGL